MKTLVTSPFRFSEFELDRTKRLLLRDGMPVSLNPKALELLLALVESRGEVLSKDELLEKVWPDQIIEEGNLKVHVSTLRKALGQSGNDHRFIVTVPGRGYSFVADLETAPDDEIVIESHRYSDLVIEDTETTSDDYFETYDAVSANTPRLVSSGRIFRRRGVLVLISLIAVGAAGLAFWFFSRASAGVSEIRSVAVMPFVNDSGNPDLEYLSDGLTESLIGSLSQLPQLSVKSASSVAKYKGKQIDPNQVGADLSVESILTGRLVQRGDEVALYVEFIEPSTSKVLWKGEYRRPMKDLAALDRDISRDVAGKVKIKLSSDDTARLERYQTNDSEAYELNLRGIHFSRYPATLERLTKSISFFEQAIQRDPDYALAYVGMAWSYIRLSSTYGYKSPHETYPKAREAVLKAIDINENIGTAHTALASYYLSYEWNWPAARREFERAMALDPEDPGTLTEYGIYYQSIGRFDDAVRVREAAAKLLPTAAPLTANIGFSCYFARQPERAIQYYQKALELNPRHAWSYQGIGMSYMDMERYADAIPQIEKAVELSERNPRTLAVLGHAYAKAGRREDATRLLRELQVRAKEENISSYFLALLYSAIDRDKAFEYLEQAVTERQAGLINLKFEPMFDDLRPDPRYELLVKNVGIPE
jgi:DNA-binding winged helix-turn-helix (wHTH) protein/TolB-like protein/Tfp pilus assembly protein PilF